MAGERAAIEVRISAHGDRDQFEVWFKPWRGSKQAHYQPILLIAGELDFDLRELGLGDLRLTITKEIREALELMQAKQIMTEGTAADRRRR